MRNLLVFLVALAMGGCGVELLTTTAIQSELNAQNASQMTRQLNNAREFSSNTSLQQAIDVYHGEKGVYPPTLDALVPEYMDAIPTHPDGRPYGYDPGSGRILDSPAPVVVSDEQTMAQIREAINRYGQATGFYPPSLAALVPQYLPAVPKTASGQDFIYDMRNGALYAPASPHLPPTAQAPRRPGFGGGGSPMAETMTGIGIQQELNGMSSAGANAAANRNRDAARGYGQAHTDSQNRAMDDLGL